MTAPLLAMIDPEGLEGLGFVYAISFFVLGLVGAAVIGVITLPVYYLVRPRRGLRGATALLAVVTIGAGLLLAQLLRLAAIGTLTAKGRPWLWFALVLFPAGVSGLVSSARLSKRSHGSSIAVGADPDVNETGANPT
jgi:hypothetical protein